MYLGYQNEKIVLVADTREELENNKFIQFDNIVETQDEYVLYKGQYLLKADAKVAQEADEKQDLLETYYKQLDQIDLKVIRPLRAQAAGIATEEDLVKIEELEAMAEQIRILIRELQN